MAVGQAVLLRPGLLERLDRWQLLEPVHPRLRRLLHRRQQLEAVIPNALAHLNASRSVFSLGRR